ncbi:MAG: TolC family outer membrane protein [Rhodobacteraceae bacterium]|nr:TolC family outer membrane protein [Paracoccaceae bacterium]
MTRPTTRLRLAALFAAGALALSPIAASAHTINETLSDAYKNSGLLGKNRAVLRAADEGVAQAISTLRPVVNYSLSGSYTDGAAALNSGWSSTYALTASLTLYDFGRNQLGVEVQKELVLATRQSLVSAEQQVLFSAARAFFDVLEASAFVGLRESNVRLITQELRAAEDRFEVGEVTRTDVAIAESRLASARSGFAAARGDLAIAQAAFEEAVGIDAHALTQPTSSPRIPDSVAAAKAIARRTHPDILASQRRITVNELNLERARRELYPTLRGSARQSFNLDTGGQGSTTLSLDYSGTISQGGRLDSLIRQAQANLDESRADLHLARLAIDEAVESAYAQLAVARASRAASEEQIRASTVAFRGVREEATLGARTTLDVLDAEQELLDARATRLSAVTAEYNAIYGILAAIGRLTAKDLGLPVQLYDPAEYYNLVKDAPRTTLSEQGAALQRVLESLGKK